MAVARTIVFAITTAVAANAHASSYPEKPIRFIVPIAPGGSNDIVARALAQRLTASLRQPVVVDNRAGGGGITGTEIAARSSPDGYTLLMVNMAHAVNPALLSKLPYDLMRDFTAITLIGLAPNVLVVHPQSPVATVGELIAMARKNPEQLSYASAGNASTPHLAMELFKLKSGIRIVHVPYKGSGPALIALMGMEVQVSFPVLSSAMPLLKSGRLKPLAVTSPTRAPAAPDVPTVRESGLPDYEFSAWFGCMAPAAVPRAIIVRLNRSMGDVLADDDFRRQFAAQGMSVAGSSPEAFARQLENELRKWEGVVRVANIRPD